MLNSWNFKDTVFGMDFIRNLGNDLTEDHKMEKSQLPYMTLKLFKLSHVFIDTDVGRCPLSKSKPLPEHSSVIDEGAG